MFFKANFCVLNAYQYRHSLDMIESSSKLLQKDTLCPHLNKGRKIKSRSLIKNHLSIFFPRMTHIFCSDHVYVGKKDLSCWIRALLYYKCDGDSSKHQSSSCTKWKQQLPKRAVILAVLWTAAKFHLELQFIGLQF